MSDDVPRRSRGTRLKHRGAPNTEPRRTHDADTGHLAPVSGRPPFREYLTQLLERRHFITLQAWSQSTTQHRGMLLGNAWLILGPALDGLTYFLIFGLILQITRGMENYFGFLVIGVFMFTYTTRCITGSVGVISANRGLIRAFTFPRASLPLASLLREAISMAPVLLTLAILLVAVPPHAQVSSYWLLVPFIFALQTTFNLGLSFIVARLGHAFPDLRHLISYGTRLWMYASAVMFGIERWESIDFLAPYMRSNPMYIFLDSYRTLLLEGAMPSASAWTALTAWSLCTFVFGVVFFWAREVDYGRTEQ